MSILYYNVWPLFKPFYYWIVFFNTFFQLWNSTTISKPITNEKLPRGCRAAKPPPPPVRFSFVLGLRMMMLMIIIPIFPPSPLPLPYLTGGGGRGGSRRGGKADYPIWIKNGLYNSYITPPPPGWTRRLDVLHWRSLFKPSIDASMDPVDGINIAHFRYFWWIFMCFWLFFHDFPTFS